MSSYHQEPRDYGNLKEMMRVYKTLYFVHMYMYENFKTLNYADKFQATFGILTIFELLFIKVS